MQNRRLGEASVKKSADEGRSLPSPGGRSFLSTPQKGTKKVTAEGTGLPWLALRHREANSHATGVLRQVPPVAPDAAPRLTPNAKSPRRVVKKYAAEGNTHTYL